MKNPFATVIVSFVSLAAVSLVSVGCATGPELDDETLGTAQLAQTAVCRVDATGLCACVNNGDCPAGQTCEDYDCQGARHCALPGHGGNQNCCTAVSGQSCKAGFACCYAQGSAGEGMCLPDGQACTAGPACDPGSPYSWESELSRICNPIQPKPATCSTCGTCNGACGCEKQADENQCQADFAGIALTGCVGAAVGAMPGLAGCLATAGVSMYSLACSCVNQTSPDAVASCVANHLAAAAAVSISCPTVGATTPQAIAAGAAACSATLVGAAIRRAACMSIANDTFNSCIDGCTPAPKPRPKPLPAPKPIGATSLHPIAG